MQVASFGAGPTPDHSATCPVFGNGVLVLVCGVDVVVYIYVWALLNWPVAVVVGVVSGGLDDDTYMYIDGFSFVWFVWTARR